MKILFSSLLSGALLVAICTQSQPVSAQKATPGTQKQKSSPGAQKVPPGAQKSPPDAQINVSDWTGAGGPSRSYVVANPAPFKADWSAQNPPLSWRASVGRGSSPVVVVGDRVITFGGWKTGTSPEAGETVLDTFYDVPEEARGLSVQQYAEKRGLKREGEYAWNPFVSFQNGNAVDTVANIEDVYASCFDADSGKLLWRTLVAKESKTGWLNTSSFSRAAPLAANGKAYFHSFDGQLAAVNIADGKLLWSQNLKDHAMLQYDEKGGNSASPLFLDGKIIVHYVGNDAPVAGANKQAHRTMVAAFDPDSGKRLWLSKPFDGNGHRVNHFDLNGGIIDGKPTVVVNTGQFLLGYNAKDGTLLWQFDYFKEFSEIGKDGNTSTLWRLVFPMGTPVITGNFIISGFSIAHQQRQSRSFCVEVKNGTPKLVWQNPDILTWRGNWAVRGTTLFAEDHNEMQWTSAKNASEALKMLQDMQNGASGAITSGTQGEIFRRPRPANLGQFAAIDIPTGKVLWSSNTLAGGGVNQSAPWLIKGLDDVEAKDGTFTKLAALYNEPDFLERVKNSPGEQGVYSGEPQFIVAGDYVIRHSWDGIRIGKIENGSLTKVAEWGGDRQSRTVLSPPVLANGRLYVRKLNQRKGTQGDGGNLLCYDLRTK